LISQENILFITTFTVIASHLSGHDDPTVTFRLFRLWQGTPAYAW